MTDNHRLLLAGDIGGTKTALALFSPDAGPRRPVAEATFPSGAYASLEAIVTQFLAGKDARLAQASFGIAGPVVDCRAQVTNLPWQVDGHALSQAVQVPVLLLNDLEAIAHAVPSLTGSDLVALNPGEPVPRGPVAVIAPGTGLGEAFLVWEAGRYRPYASEGGHADFAPTTPTQVELLIYLQARFGHVSYERVCSGRGLPNMYSFLKDRGHFTEPGWLREQLAAADDPTPVIVQVALEKKADLGAAALDMFVAILGSEAGNLALKVMAIGGVYLGGGIPPRILPRLKEAAFMQAFTRKGRFSELLARVPVHVIANPKVALYGAACHGLEQLAGL